ncbi:sulfotransferase domain-containing protein [Seonamhaeicola maritimus]|uniref:sulfotransferase domain-containing protein n=1 Tax=Seonamhaeicola maritimus TaxID=2591822 RepID=UPI0024944392|nr:sulfotransferase domain-containing protein [Seonamhaeicola maritimus]
MIQKKIKQFIYKRFEIENLINKSIEDSFKSQGYTGIGIIQESDIFIAGYPKSGNTWMQGIVGGLLLDSTSELLTTKLLSEVVPDVHAKKYYKRFFKSMVFKTHDLPKPEYKKVIHLVRDGRDVMVSYYNMGKNKSLEFPFSLKDMVIDGKGLYPSKWYQHSKEWIDNPFKAEIMLLKYEDLHEFPLREMRRISKFIGLELPDSRLMAIYDNNGIENVRSRVAKYGMDNDYTWKNKPITSFFRKGQVGNFKDEMSIELINYFNSEAKDELEYFKYL